MVLVMKSNESTVPVATFQFRIVNVILQFLCNLAHYRSVEINPVVESRVPNPNTALIFVFFIIVGTI
jgi:hypothetical protein